MKTGKILLLLIFIVKLTNSLAQFSSYGYQKVITIDHTNIGSNLTDYPLLIDAQDNDLKSTVNGGHVQSSSGYDIAFYDKNTNKLDHEIELYNETTGKYVAWVKIPTVSSSEDTKVFMVYGKSGVTTNPSTVATWNDDFLAVYHFSDDVSSTTFNESTANSSDGTAPAAITRITGKAGYGREFNGSSDFIWVDDTDLHADFPSKNASATTEFTISAWVYLDDISDRGPFVSKQTGGSGNERGYVFMLEDNQKMKLEAFQSDNTNCSDGRWEIYSTSTVSTGNWYNVAVTYKFDGTNSESRLYIDGSEVAYDEICSNAPIRNNWGPIQSNDRDFEIGRYYWLSSYVKYFDGKLDEVRVSKKAFSADWIAVEYTNVTSSTDLYSVSDEEATDLYRWEGISDSDWSNTDNWLPALEPNSAKNVIIAADITGSNFPESITGDNPQCNNLTIEAGAKLYVSPGKTLMLSGDLTNNGTLRLESDNSGTGNIIDNGTITGSGNAYVERYIWLDQWHYLSVPVQSVNSQFFTNTSHGWNPNFLYYDETKQWPDGWTYAHDGEGGTGNLLDITKGYAYYYNGYETLVFNGTLNTGAYTTGQGGLPALSYTDFNSDGDDSKDGWNLVGNPYPSAIDWDMLSLTHIDNSLYFWNGSNYEYYVGSGGTDYEGTGTLSGNSYIPAMQAFFVKANAPNPQISFTNAARVASSKNFYKKSKKQQAEFVKLKVENNDYSDETIIRFIPQATPVHDGKFDAYKIFTNNNQVPQIYTTTKNEDEKLAINSLPCGKKNSIIPLGFKAGVSGNYSLWIQDKNLKNTEVWIEDKKTGVFNNLLKGAYYFNYSTSDLTDRFILHFNSLPLSNQLTTQEEIMIYSISNEIILRNYSSPINKIEVYDMLGNKVHIQPIHLTTGEIRFKLQKQSGVYLVKVLTSQGISTRKVFIQ